MREVGDHQQLLAERLADLVVLVGELLLELADLAALGLQCLGRVGVAVRGGVRRPASTDSLTRARSVSRSVVMSRSRTSSAAARSSAASTSRCCAAPARRERPRSRCGSGGRRSRQRGYRPAFGAGSAVRAHQCGSGASVRGELALDVGGGERHLVVADDLGVGHRACRAGSRRCRRAARRSA